MIKAFLTSNSHFQLKYESSSEEVHLLLSLTSKSNNIFVYSCFEPFSLDLCIFLSWFRPDDFLTEESNIMDRGVVF